MDPSKSHSLYENDSSRLIGRFIADADAKAKAASAMLDNLSAAKAAATAAEAAYLDSLDERDAIEFSNAKRRAENLGFCAAAIENAGGVAGIRERALLIPAVFAALATGLRDRSDALGKLLPAARKRLAEARAALTEQGVGYFQIDAQPEIRQLRAAVERIENDAREADVCRQWCQRWNPETRDRNFDDLLGTLTAPLPA